MNNKTQTLINHYINRKNRLIAIQEECNQLRDEIAKRLLRENPNGFHGLTAYKVSSTIVKQHRRSGYNALRIF